MLLLQICVLNLVVWSFWAAMMVMWYLSFNTQLLLLCVLTLPVWVYPLLDAVVLVSESHPSCTAVCLPARPAESLAACLSACLSPGGSGERVVAVPLACPPCPPAPHHRLHVSALPREHG